MTDIQMIDHLMSSLTAEQIRDARDRYPEDITSQCAADAQSLPRGPFEDPLLPCDVSRARERIAVCLMAKERQ